MSGELTERTGAAVRRSVSDALDQLGLAEGYLERSTHVEAHAAVHRLVDELENTIAAHEVLAVESAPQADEHVGLHHLEE
jgi:hypothetical protein